jgi:hypothetical protein
MLRVCTAAFHHCDWPFGYNAHLGTKVPNSKNTSPRRAYPGKRKAPLLREALDGETLGLGELGNSTLHVGLAEAFGFLFLGKRSRRPIYQMHFRQA